MATYDYVFNEAWTGTAAGTKITWNGKEYTFGTDAFASWNEARLKVWANGGTLGVVGGTFPWYVPATHDAYGAAYIQKDFTVILDSSNTSGDAGNLTDCKLFVVAKGVSTSVRNRDITCTVVFDDPKACIKEVEFRSWQNMRSYMNYDITINGGTLGWAPTHGTSGVYTGAATGGLNFNNTVITMNDGYITTLNLNQTGASTGDSQYTYSYAQVTGYTLLTVNGGTINELYGFGTGGGKRSTLGARGLTENTDILTISINESDSAKPTVINKRIYVTMNNRVIGNVVATITGGTINSGITMMANTPYVEGNVILNLGNTGKAITITGNVIGHESGTLTGKAVLNVLGNVTVDGSVGTFDTVNLKLGKTLTMTAALANNPDIVIDTTSAAEGTSAYLLASTTTYFSKKTISLTGTYAEEFATRLLDQKLYAYNAVYVNGNWSGSTGDTVNFTIGDKNYTAIYGVNAFSNLSDAKDSSVAQNVDVVVLEGSAITAGSWTGIKKLTLAGGTVSDWFGMVLPAVVSVTGGSAQSEIVLQKGGTATVSGGYVNTLTGFNANGGTSGVTDNDVLYTATVTGGSIASCRGMKGAITVYGCAELNVSGGFIATMFGIDGGTASSVTGMTLNLSQGGSVGTVNLVSSGGTHSGNFVLNVDGSVATQISALRSNTTHTGDLTVNVTENAGVTGAVWLVRSESAAGATLNGDLTLNVSGGSFAQQIVGLYEDNDVVNGDLVINVSGGSFAAGITGIRTSGGTVTGKNELNFLNTVSLGGDLSGFKTITVSAAKSVTTTGTVTVAAGEELILGAGATLTGGTLAGAGSVVFDASAATGTITATTNSFSGKYYLTFDGGATRTEITESVPVIYNGKSYSITIGTTVSVTSTAAAAPTAITAIAGTGGTFSGGLTGGTSVTESGKTLYSGLLDDTVLTGGTAGSRKGGLYFGAGETEKTGSVQLDINLNSDKMTRTIYGGGNTGTNVAGDVTVNFQAGTSTYLFGGGYTGTTISGDVAVNFEAGTITSTYAAGGASDTVSGNLTTTVSSGSVAIADLYAGSRVPKGSGATTSAASGKTITLDIQGGSFSNMTIGGSYVMSNAGGTVSHTDGDSVVKISGATFTGRILSGAAYANNSSSGGAAGAGMTVTSGDVSFSMKDSTAGVMLSSGTATLKYGIALGGVASNAERKTGDVTASFSGDSKAYRIQGGWSQKDSSFTAGTVSIDISGGSYGIVQPGINVRTEGGTGTASGTISAGIVTVSGGTVDKLRANSTTEGSTVLGDSLVTVTGGTVRDFIGAWDNTIGGDLEFTYGGTAAMDSVMDKATLVYLGGTVGGNVNATLSGGTVNSFTALSAGTVTGAVTVNFAGSTMTGDTVITGGTAKAASATANVTAETTFRTLTGKANGSTINTALNVDASVTVTDKLSNFDTVNLNSGTVTVTDESVSDVGVSAIGELNIALGSKIKGDVTIASGETLNVVANTSHATTTQTLYATVEGTVSNSGTIGVTGEYADGLSTLISGGTLYAVDGYYVDCRAGTAMTETQKEYDFTDAYGNTKTATVTVNGSGRYAAFRKALYNGGTCYISGDDSWTYQIQGGVTTEKYDTVVFDTGCSKPITVIFGSLTDENNDPHAYSFSMEKQHSAGRDMTLDIRSGTITGNVNMGSWQGVTSNARTHVIMRGGTVANLHASSTSGTHTGTSDVLMEGGTVTTLVVSLYGAYENKSFGCHTAAATLTMNGGTVGTLCGTRNTDDTMKTLDPNNCVVGIAGGTASTIGTDIITMTINGGSVSDLYGAWQGTVYGNVKTTVKGGEILNSLYGVNNGTMTGDFVLTVSGGQVWGTNLAVGDKLNMTGNVTATYTDGQHQYVRGKLNAGTLAGDLTITIDGNANVNNYVAAVESAGGTVTGLCTVNVGADSTLGTYDALFVKGVYSNTNTGTGAVMNGFTANVKKGNVSELFLAYGGTEHGDETVNVSGGEVGYLYCCRSAAVDNDNKVEVNLTGGGIRKIIGQNYAATFSHDVSVSITGGTCGNFIGVNNADGKIVGNLSLSVTGGKFATYGGTVTDGKIIGVAAGTLQGNFTVTLGGTATVMAVTALTGGSITGTKMIAFSSFTGSNGAITGFDTVDFSGTGNKFSNFTAQTAQTWNFDLSGTADTTLSTWTGITNDFTGDVINIDLADTAAAETLAVNSSSTLSNLASATFHFMLDGVEQTSQNGVITAGDYSGWGVTTENGNIVFKSGLLA